MVADEGFAIDLRTRRIDIPELIEVAWRRRVRVALRPIAGTIRSVVVRVVRQAGDDADVRCLVRVVGLDGRVFLAGDTHRDAGRALAVALDRAARAVVRYRSQADDRRAS